MAEERAGLRIGMRGTRAVQSFIKKSEADANRIKQILFRNEQNIGRQVQQVARTTFSTLGNATISFAASEVISSTLASASGSRTLGFLTGVGTGLATGFATGGVAGATIGALAASVSQLFGAFQDAKRRQEEIENAIRELKRTNEQLIRNAEEARRERERQLELIRERILGESFKEAEALVLNSWRYL